MRMDRAFLIISREVEMLCLQQQLQLMEHGDGVEVNPESWTQLNGSLQY